LSSRLLGVHIVVAAFVLGAFFLRFGVIMSRSGDIPLPAFLTSPWFIGIYALVSIILEFVFVWLEKGGSYRD